MSHESQLLDEMLAQARGEKPWAPIFKGEAENFVKREDGLWEHALPYPLMGVRTRCDCGRYFWTMAGYARHWRSAHDGNRIYQRRRGFEEVSRPTSEGQK